MPDRGLNRGSWLVTLALAGGGMLYLFCAFLPNARAIHALREETRVRKSFAAQAPLLTVATAKLQKTLVETKNFAAQNRRQLPDSAGLPELGAQITRQADRAGARTTRFEPQSPKILASLRIVPIVFAGRGNFLQLCQMLAGVEGLPERIWVDEMRLQMSGESGKDAECSLKLNVFAGNSEKSD